MLEKVISLLQDSTIQVPKILLTNIREEALNFDGLYDKLAFLIVNGKTEKPDKTNLFDLFEKQFGRPLSPMEYEIINGWKEVNFEEELIVLALKEAAYNGVNNLRYIDKILYEWKKKGIRSKEDVEREKQAFKQVKEAPKTELFDYDWLNDHE